MKNLLTIFTLVLGINAYAADDCTVYKPAPYSNFVGDVNPQILDTMASNGFEFKDENLSSKYEVSFSINPTVFSEDSSDHAIVNKAGKLAGDSSWEKVSYYIKDKETNKIAIFEYSVKSYDYTTFNEVIPKAVNDFFSCEEMKKLKHSYASVTVLADSKKQAKNRVQAAWDSYIAGEKIDVFGRRALSYHIDKDDIKKVRVKSCKLEEKNQDSELDLYSCELTIKLKDKDELLISNLSGLSNKEEDSKAAINSAERSEVKESQVAREPAITNQASSSISN